MTKLLAEALAATDTLPPEVQDELARMILAFAAREKDVYVLSEDEIRALDESEAGDFATEAEIEALWTKPRG